MVTNENAGYPHYGMRVIFATCLFAVLFWTAAANHASVSYRAGVAVARLAAAFGFAVHTTPVAQRAVEAESSALETDKVPSTASSGRKKVASK